MTTYKHTKVVDDDVRQEIATILRGRRVICAMYAELLQDLGELCMCERWGVKGDMHAQVDHTYAALNAKDAAERQRREVQRAVDHAKVETREVQRKLDAALSHTAQLKATLVVRDRTITALSDQQRENPWRRAARLTLADARRRVSDVIARVQDVAEVLSGGGT